MRRQEVRTITCPGAHGGKEPGYRSGCVWLRCLHYFHYTTLPASLVLFICGTTGKEILTLPQGKLMTDLYFLLTTLLRYNSHTIKFSPLKCTIWWFLRSSELYNHCYYLIRSLICFLCVWTCPALDIHMNGITPYVAFGIWLPSFSIILTDLFFKVHGGYRCNPPSWKANICSCFQIPIRTEARQWMWSIGINVFFNSIV